MSEPPELPNRIGPPEDPSTGWFAYPQDGSASEPDEDPVITDVELRVHEYAGPFWDHGGHLSDDYDELHRWLGISRELYDDAIAWNDSGGDWDEQQRLLRRLRQELPDRIRVPAARGTGPREVVLARLRVGVLDGEPRLLERHRLGKPSPEPLPRTDLGLMEDVAVWLKRSPRFMFGIGDDQAHFEWEDQGSDLYRRLLSVWGPDFTVRIW